MQKRKLVPVVLGFGLIFNGCAVLEQIVADSYDINPPPVVTVIEKPLIVPTILPTPTLKPKKLVPICGKRSSNDGIKRGFVWKPNSDTQHWAVAVIPTDQKAPCTIRGKVLRYKGEFTERSIHIFDKWTGQMLKNKFGSIVVKCGCSEWTIKDPSKRTD